MIGTRRPPVKTGCGQVITCFWASNSAVTDPIANSPVTARPLILASTSSYRRVLLQRLRRPFTAVAPKVDEAALPGEGPRVRAARLALAKARAVAEREPGALVIGSDQVCALGDVVLGKPGDAANNRLQLQQLSGRTATFFTATSLVCVASGLWLQHVDTTICVFRTLTDDEIVAYVAAEKPFDCAGGFKAEGLGISLFERIDSQDPSGLIGLPLIWLAGALRQSDAHVPR